MKYILFTLGLVFSSLLLPFTTLADTNGCQANYGSASGYGSTQCSNGSISINKTVQNPSNNQFVDNLGANDPKYAPLQQVNFQLTVSNTGNATLNNIVVKDMFPQYLNFAASNGTYDANSNTVTITLDHLDAGASQTYTVVGRVVDTNSLPANTGVTCVVNQSTAIADSQSLVQDNAQFCIEKQVLGTTTKGGLTIYNAPKTNKTPGTGPEAFSLLALIPAAFAGLKLRKKSIRG